MRTIELSNDKARQFAEFVAERWALVATNLLRATTDVNIPFQRWNEPWKGEPFKRRVKDARREAAILAEVLIGLGATMPEVDLTLVVPYKPPRPTRRKMTQVRNTDAERKRLIKAIIASMN